MHSQRHMRGRVRSLVDGLTALRAVMSGNTMANVLSLRVDQLQVRCWHDSGCAQRGSHRAMLHACCFSIRECI